MNRKSIHPGHNIMRSGNETEEKKLRFFFFLKVDGIRVHIAVEFFFGLSRSFRSFVSSPGPIAKRSKFQDLSQEDAAAADAAAAATTKFKPSFLRPLS